MPVRFQDKRGTATQWRLANPVLADGEFGIESDTGVVKVGNGLDGWNARPAILGSTYLPILGKAADADKLDGLDSTAFLKVTDATATYLPSATAATTYLRQDAPVSAPTANAVVKRDQYGNVSNNEVMLSGQTTPASATRKDYVDAISTALTNATGSTAASRKLGYYWGSVTAFPTVGVLAGDTCLRTNIGTNGSWWSYTGVAALGSAGWLPEGTITCLSTTRPTTALFKGLQIYESDTQFLWEYDGTGNWLPLTVGACYGRAWKADGFSNTFNNTNVNVNFSNARVSGGVLYSTANGGRLSVPLDGIYRVASRGYMTGGGTGNANAALFRVRVSVADAYVANVMLSKWNAGIDEVKVASDLVPLKAGDVLYQQMQFGNNSAPMAFYGNGEYQGQMMSAEWVGPLNGATPI